MDDMIVYVSEKVTARHACLGLLRMLVSFGRQSVGEVIPVVELLHETVSPRRLLTSLEKAITKSGALKDQRLQLEMDDEEELLSASVFDVDGTTIFDALAIMSGEAFRVELRGTNIELFRTLADAAQLGCAWHSVEDDGEGADEEDGDEDWNVND